MSYNSKIKVAHKNKNATREEMGEMEMNMGFGVDKLSLNQSVTESVFVDMQYSISFRCTT